MYQRQMSAQRLDFNFLLSLVCLQSQHCYWCYLAMWETTRGRLFCVEQLNGSLPIKEDTENVGHVGKGGTKTLKS